MTAPLDIAPLLTGKVLFVILIALDLIYDRNYINTVSNLLQ
jgi:hypothetical protein